MIDTGKSSSQRDDPEASHFKVTTNDQGALNQRSVRRYDVLDFNQAASTDSRSAQLVIVDSCNVACRQAGNVNGTLGIG